MNELSVLEEFLNQEQFHNYVAVIPSSRIYSKSVEISRRQLQFLYNVITTRPADIDLWLRSAMSFDHLTPYQVGDEMSEFLCELCKALYKHDTEIEYLSNNKWDEVSSRSLANMLYLYGEPLRKEDIEDAAAMFACLFEGVFDLRESARWFIDDELNSSVHVHHMEDFPLYVAKAACKPSKVQHLQLIDLPDELFEQIFKMAMYQHALSKTDLPKNTIQGLYLSQSKYCKQVSACARLHSKFYNSLPQMQIGSLVTLESIPKLLSRRRNLQDDHLSNVCIVDKDVLSVKSPIPYVDMRFLFPNHTKDRPNLDGICKHENDFKTCKECDKSVKVAMLNMGTKETCYGTVDVNLWCNVNCKLASSVKDSQHLHSKHFSNGMGYLVAPHQLELCSEEHMHFTKRDLFVETRSNNVSEYFFSIRHRASARSPQGFGLKMRTFDSTSIITPCDENPVQLTTRLIPLKTTHLYPSGIQFIPSNLSMPMTTTRIQVKRPPSKEHKAKKRKLLEAASNL